MLHSIVKTSYSRVFGGREYRIWIEECIPILLLPLDFNLGKYLSLTYSINDAIEFGNLANFPCFRVFGGSAGAVFGRWDDADHIPALGFQFGQV